MNLILSQIVHVVVTQLVGQLVAVSIGVPGLPGVTIGAAIHAILEFAASKNPKLKAYLGL